MIHTFKIADLEEYFNKYRESIEMEYSPDETLADLVSGDFNINPLNNLGLNMAIDGDTITIETPSNNPNYLRVWLGWASEEAESISNGEMPPGYEEDFEGIDDLFGGFFDGGDDCDYAGSFPGMLIDTILFSLKPPTI